MKHVNDNPIDAFVKNILETRFENISPITIDQAKKRIIDTIGCLIGGAGDPGNPELVELLKNQGGKPEATILLYGDKVPVGHAAMANCILCRSFDFEPVSPVVGGQLTPGHISGTTVMTALSLAEVCGVSGKELITSMLVGDDITARVLATSGFSIDLGWDGNGTGNALGATAIAGRMLGLNPNQLRHALGLVLSQMAGTMQNIWDATPSFKLPQGLSARNGIFSAQLAGAGWTGPDDPLLSAHGYYNLYTKGIKRPELLTEDLGKLYYADRAIKPYPACRATHATIECALGMVDKYGFEAEDISEVHIYMHSQALNNFCGKPLDIGPFPHSAAAFSYQYTVAVALMAHSVKPRHFTAAFITDPVTRAFVDKVNVSPWPKADIPGVGIKVVLKNGKEYLETGLDAKGDFIDNPLSDDEFYAKFQDNIEFSQKMSAERGEKILSLLQNLEAMENVAGLVDLLVIENN